MKNFEGEYYYENDKLYFDPQYQIKNAESALRQLVDQMGYNWNIKKFVFFINNDFTLFQAPRNSGILLPGMLKSHFSMVNEISGRLNQNHYRFAEEIKPMHMEDFSLHNVPYYENELLKKGVTCFYCGSFIEVFTKNRTCICKYCSKEEKVSQTVIRHAQEYIRLFPEQKITTAAICNWCDNRLSICRIRYIFNKHLTAKGTGRWRYYELKKLEEFHKKIRLKEI